MHRVSSVLIALSATACFAGSLTATATAADPGWQVLFDGKNLDAWQATDGGKPGDGWVIEDGAVIRKEKAGYIWTKQRFGDFVLDLEFKAEGNSGIFIRTDDLKNCVQTGLEFQINTPSSSPSKHSTGALYDAQAPSKVADKPDAWNHIVITAQDSKITVVMNDEKIIDADLDQWTEAKKNPDGTPNKFRTPLAEFKREGHIGLQEHGAQVAYRNIRVRVLK